MILTCEKCDTSFSFDESLIKPSGSKVRCSKCRNVFVVKPPAAAAKADAGVEDLPSGMAAAAGVTGLDDLDLAAIEKSLDLDIGRKPDAGLAAAGDVATKDDDFNFDAADFAAAADVGAITADSDTDDLSFELDLDSLADDNDTTSGVTDGSTETMDFELDLDFDHLEAETASAEAATPTTDEIDFDLDFKGLEDAAADSEGAQSFGATAAADTGSEEDLDFGLDMDFDNATGGSESDILDFKIDSGSEEKSVVSDPKVEFDETQELDLSDVDSLLDLGHDETGAPAEGDQAEDLDLELDLEADAPTEQDTAAGTEATEELDLAELEEMIEKAENTPLPQDSVEDDAEFDLELDLDPAFDAVEEKTKAAAPDDVEITDDLDLTGLDELLEEDAVEEPAVQRSAESESSAVQMDLTDEPTLANEEAGAVALDDMLELAQEEPEAEGVSAESTEEFDLEFDSDESNAADTSIEVPKTATIDDNEDAEFDLSNLDDMLELADEPSGDASQAEDDDLDLQFDLEEMPGPDAKTGAETGAVTAAGTAGDLEFEVEEETDHIAAPAAAAVTAAGEDAAADTFGMGDLSEDEKALDADSDETFTQTEEMEAAALAETAKKQSGGLMRALFVLVLLVAVGAGALFAARYLGIDIPYLDKVKGVKIPYVSDLLGPKAEDAGNLKIAIDEKDVNGRFVNNEKLGALYVVSGQVKNEYDNPRSSIRVTGKIYSKGRKLELEKTVYAGNVLSDSDLGVIDQAGIDQKLQNRFGQERKNLDVKKGATLPFMIVFSDLPKNPDEYTVEVAGSQKAK
ncbi:MAG: zinc-ribbon domain-containing protein [Desulfobacterales bacterium]